MKKNDFVKASLHYPSKTNAVDEFKRFLVKEILDTFSIFCVVNKN